MDYNGIVAIEHPSHTLEVCINTNETNSLNLDSFLQFEKILDQYSNNEKFRVLVLTAGGENYFSNGFDPKNFLDKSKTEIEKFLDVVLRVTMKYHIYPTPTIAMIQGHTMGMGAALSIESDFRFMNSKKGRIGFPEALIGLNFPTCMGKNLINLVGFQPAKDLLYTGRSLKSDEALKMGLVDEIHPPDQLKQKTFEKAAKISEMPPSSSRGMKQCFIEFDRTRFLDLVKTDIQGLANSIHSIYGQEGMRSIVEKRRPDFQSLGV
jgi:enoyl-CoA hydratase/carnithine racemase